MTSTIPPITLDVLRAALALPNFDVIAARMRMAPSVRPFQRLEREGKAKQSAVLMLTYPHPPSPDLHLVLIQRAEGHGAHSGQISFPGGRQEAGETPIETALRETDEEVGANGADILGQFESLYVPPSDFEIHPVIGYTPLRPEWKPHAAEVAAILEAPLSVLLDDSLKGHEPFVRGEITFEKHYYLICGQQVWGATAILLSELERRLRAVLAE